MPLETELAGSNGLSRRQTLTLMGAGAAGVAIAHIVGELAAAPATAAILWNHPFQTRHSGSAFFDDFNPKTWTDTGYHHALDLNASAGQTVYSCAAGTVVESYFNIDNMLGNLVVIDHGEGYKTAYAHLQSAGLHPVGAVLAAASAIGYVGNTGGVGFTYDPHLHVEMRHPDRSNRVNCNFLETAPLAGTDGTPIPTEETDDMPKPLFFAANAPSSSGVIKQGQNVHASGILMSGVWAMNEPGTPLRHLSAEEWTVHYTRGEGVIYMTGNQLEIIRAANLQAP